jgi:hypothetical protein
MLCKEVLMTWLNGLRSKPRQAAWLAAGVAAVFALGTFAGPASARWAGRDEHREYHHSWTGGYYNAPPVVYGQPYGYYPPPVVYGPGVGINLPGVHIGIR